MECNGDVHTRKQNGIKISPIDIILLIIIVILYSNHGATLGLIVFAAVVILNMVSNIVKQVQTNIKRTKWNCSMLSVTLLQEDKSIRYRESKNGPYYYPQRIVCEGQHPITGAYVQFDTGFQKIRYGKYVTEGSRVPIYVNPQKPEKYFIDYENASESFASFGYQDTMSVGQFGTDDDYAREAQRIAMEMADNPQMAQQMQQEQQSLKSSDEVVHNKVYTKQPNIQSWPKTLFASGFLIVFGIAVFTAGIDSIKGNTIDLSFILNAKYELIPFLFGIVLIVAGISAIVYKIQSAGKTPEQLAAEQPQVTEEELEALRYMSGPEQLKFIYQKNKEAKERSNRNGY